MVTILDLNNFWSPSGGGVRRYHLERMAYYKTQENFLLVFLMQDARSWTEVINEHLIIEHVKAVKIPGAWDYRFLANPFTIRRYLLKYQPQIVEVGSPYWLPIAVRWATWGLKIKPALVGFWHADFPVTYVRRGLGHVAGWLGRLGESVAWLYARWAYADYRIIEASSCEIMSRMITRGLDKVHWIPLGVDVDRFRPECRDDELVAELKDGQPERLTIFFPHRLTEEKGVPTLLAAYPKLCERLGVEPAVIFASIGPFKQEILDASAKWPHLRYIGFVNGLSEMARWYASTDMGLALSGWETFGLSILESMACGQCVIGANQGAAKEHVESAGCGATIPGDDPDALVEAIVHIVKSGRLSELGLKARTFAEQFTWQACFTRQIALYQSILKP